MLSVNAALMQIISQAERIDEHETLPIDKAVNRILAESQFALIDVPPADNSAMDGYAIAASSLGSGPTRLPISQTMTAGAVGQALTANTAARIFTGAEIPVGADTVVIQEQCEQIDNDVIIPAGIDLKANIRPQGQDIKAGSIILEKGRQLQPQDIGLLAAVGLTHVSVYRPLKVAIISTGNELVDPGKTLQPGQIYNSNRYLLSAFLHKQGCDILDLGIVPDDLEKTVDFLKQASEADCIISTGGVSVGEEDYVKAAVDQLGALELWRIAMKPGKPLAFGDINGTPFFGLPGNPVSTFVTFTLFVKPFLHIQQGTSHKTPHTIQLVSNFAIDKKSDRQEYLRVTIEGDRVDRFNNQSSGVLSSLVQSDGLAIIPPGQIIKRGEQLDVIPFDQLY